MTLNTGMPAVAPRTHCRTSWQQVALVVAIFVFAGWLVLRGEDVRTSLAVSTGAMAVVLLVSSVRMAGLRAFATRMADSRTESYSPLPGMI